MGAGELARAPLSKLFLQVVLVVSNLKTRGEKRRSTRLFVSSNTGMQKLWYNVCC